MDTEFSGLMLASSGLRVIISVWCRYGACGDESKRDSGSLLHAYMGGPMSRKHRNSWVQQRPLNAELSQPGMLLPKRVTSVRTNRSVAYMSALSLAPSGRPSEAGGSWTLCTQSIGHSEKETSVSPCSRVPLAQWLERWSYEP